MSTVIHPRGPLSPRVYWTRRLLLVVVVMVLAALVWWVMPGVGGSGSAAAGPAGGAPVGHQPSSTTPTTTQTTGGDTPGKQPAVTHHPTPHHASGTTQPTQDDPTKGPSGPKHRALPPPTGPCDPTKVTLAVVVDNAPEGQGTTVGLRMSTQDGSSCSLGITPSLLETRITSGIATVWQSGSCPDALPAKNVVVRPKPAVVYSYAWDGQLNPDSCSATNVVGEERLLLGGGRADRWRARQDPVRGHRPHLQGLKRHFRPGARPG